MYILLIMLAYFLILIGISRLVSRKIDTMSFFNGNKKSPWYVVAFGMIGTTLSGVTFISVPGWVEASQFSYMQMVFGYMLGYFVIATVLLPLYYRLNLVSIYSYLQQRFGNYSYKTGSSFFLLSRIVGSSFRLFLVANVLQLLVFDPLQIPFWVNVLFTIAMIWVYTYRAGIKVIVWTDALQTFCMLFAMGFILYKIQAILNINIEDIGFQLLHSSKTKIFFFEDATSSKYFWNLFFSGAFIAIVMTGLDQDMMQKNLSCKTLKEAQKNMLWFSVILLLVNFVFLLLGYLLLEYSSLHSIDASKDSLFPTIATRSEMGWGVKLFFIIGLIAAAFSSIDSALTSMTTSVSIDILGIQNIKDEKQQVNQRKKIHFLLCILIFGVIISFKYLIADQSVISQLLLFAGYTYGPLLGLYAFGLFYKKVLKDKLVPYIAIASPVLAYLIAWTLKEKFRMDLGYFVLIVNGGITYLGLLCICVKTKTIKT